MDEPFRVPGDRQGEVGQRGEVPGCPDRAFFRDVGIQISVQEIQEALDHDLTNARIASSQRVGPQHDDGPHDIFRQGIAKAAGMRSDQVVLKPPDLFSIDADIPFGTEAGRDPIDFRPASNELIDDRSASADSLPSLLREGDSSAPSGDGHHLLDGERESVELYVFLGVILFVIHRIPDFHMMGCFMDDMAYATRSRSLSRPHVALLGAVPMDPLEEIKGSSLPSGLPEASLERAGAEIGADSADGAHLSSSGFASSLPALDRFEQDSTERRTCHPPVIRTRGKRERAAGVPLGSLLVTIVYSL